MSGVVTQVDEDGVCGRGVTGLVWARTTSDSVPSSSEPQRLGAVLSDLVDRYGYRERLDAARAVEAWPTVAGPAIAGVTEQVWMRHGALHVKVRSAAWRHQLGFQRAAWRARMNEHLGREVVDEVVFR